jgi:putative cell wall-binding protein
MATPRTTRHPQAMDRVTHRLAMPLARLGLAVALVATMLAASAPSRPLAAASATTPFATWEVQIEDIAGLGSPRTEVLVKAFSPKMNVVAYLDEAAKYGQKVVAYFTDTVDYAHGTVYPGRVAPWLTAAVRNHPALFGYLTVKEPSWNGISVSEIRALRSAFRAVDAKHPTIALLGDVPNFGTSKNPWTTSMADILWVDWYPVTFSRGYIGTASTYFPRIRAYVNKVTPGTPIWLSVQGHEYRPGDRRRPSGSELEREVRDGMSYLKADGIVFYTYHNPLYNADLERNGSLWSTAHSIISRTRSGTFMPKTTDPSVSGFSRLWGSDRYATAVAISKATFPSGATVAYLATGLGFADAIAGTVAAARARAPILLTPTDSLPASVAVELSRLDPDRVVVLGGTGAVSGAVVTSVKAALPSAKVTRVAGADRYATAAAISKATFPSGAPVAYLTTGLGYTDGLPGAVAAARAGGPLLLATTDSLPSSIATELARLAPGRVVVLGGAAAVSDAVVSAVKAKLPGVSISRVYGADRYATAVAISRSAFPNGAGEVYLATGLDFADALAGTVAAALGGGPLLLTSPSSLPSSVGTELGRLNMSRLVVLGGSGAVSYQVAWAAARYL